MTGGRGLQLRLHLQEMHRSQDYSLKTPIKIGDSGAFAIHTQDLPLDFTKSFQMMQHSILIFNYLSAEDKLNLKLKGKSS